MIDLSFYVNAIAANVPAVQQVIQPERVSLTTLDTSALLTALMEPQVSNRVYAYKLPADVAYPAITYELTGSHREEVDGYVITKTDVFIVSVQSETLDDLITVIDAVKTVLITYAATNAAGGIEISDQAVTYHPDLQRFESALEVRVTHLALPSQLTPAYYLYPISEKAEPSQSANGTLQLVDEQFAGLLVVPVPASGVSGIAALRNDLFNQIIDKKPGNGAGRTEFVQGQVAGLVGSVVLWRDVFSVQTKQHYC